MIDNSIKIFSFVIASFLFFGSIISFFVVLNENNEYLFDNELIEESFVESFPPFIDRADDYENVVETQNDYLVLDDQDLSGFYVSENLGEEIHLSEWDRVEYYAKKVSDSHELRIEISNDEDFSEIIDLKSVNLQNNYRNVDLSDFDRSRYLRFIVNFESGDDVELRELDVYGSDLVGEEEFLNWIVVSFIISVVVIMILFLVAVVIPSFNS